MNKEEFYQNYYSGHLVNYKGTIDLNSVKADARVYTASFKEFLPADKNIIILDLACGLGKVVYALQQMGYRNVAGVELSGDLVKRAAELGIPGVIEGDIIKYLTEAKSGFDVIILKDIIEHFKLDETRKLLELCHSRLNTGGRLVIHCPNGESPLFGRVLYGDITHEMAFTTRSISQLLRSTGFTKFLFFEDKKLFSLRRIHKILLWKIVRVMFKLFVYAESEAMPKVITQNFYTLAFR